MNAENPIISSLNIVVKAEQLFKEKLTPETQEKIIDKYTSLTDGNGFGSPFGSNNKKQLTVIYEASEMVWSIALSDKVGDKGYEVVLDSIDQGKSGFFTKISKVDGKIVGQVTTNPDFDRKEENYTIKFHIAKGKESTPILPIDPKLQIRRRPQK